jgi:hypothetical protein
VLMDLVGVAWLMRRTMHYQVVTTWDAAELLRQVTSGNGKPTRLPRIFACQSWED